MRLFRIKKLLTAPQMNVNKSYLKYNQARKFALKTFRLAKILNLILNKLSLKCIEIV